MRRRRTAGANTALALAAEVGRHESVRLLLDAGAAPRRTKRIAAGSRRCIASVFNCDLAAVKLLLAKGAKPNTKARSPGKVKFGDIQLVGLTPLLIASGVLPRRDGGRAARSGRAM